MRFNEPKSQHFFTFTAMSKAQRLPEIDAGDETSNFRSKIDEILAKIRKILGFREVEFWKFGDLKSWKFNLNSDKYSVC